MIIKYCATHESRDEESLLKNFLRVGEFANLCRTTKDTILHYARKGILEPKKISRNGYRYYSPDQFWAFSLLALLKETGSSLSEIGKAHNGNGGRAYIEFIKDKLTDLAAHRDNLTQRIDMLGQLVSLTEEALCSPLDVPICEDMPASLVRYHKINPDDMLFSFANPDVYSTCLKKELELGNTVYPPLGLVVPAENAISGNLRVEYIFSECGNCNLPGSKTIEGGKYIKMIHFGDLSSHRIYFRYLMHDIINNEQHPAGDVLIYDQMNFLIEPADENFWGKYMVHIGN